MDQATRCETSASEGGACLKSGRSALAGLRLDGDGLCCLGNDGVNRSFSSVGQVVDYRRFSPEQISNYLDKFAGFYPNEEMKRLKIIFDGVDGREVDDRKCVEPDVEDIPSTCLENKRKAEAESSRDVQG